jgi:hypothetical protein
MDWVEEVGTVSVGFSVGFSVGVSVGFSVGVVVGISTSSTEPDQPWTVL